MLDAVETLQHRLEFIDTACELARLCDWKEKEVAELAEQLWDELVQVDTAALRKMDEGTDEAEAYQVWEEGMENIRYWLALVLGIKIRFV